MTLDEELARVDVVALDTLLDAGEITLEEYIHELKEIDNTYGTHIYVG